MWKYDKSLILVLHLMLENELRCPWITMWEGLEREKDEFFFKYVYESALRASRVVYVKCNLNFAKLWYMLGACYSGIVKETPQDVTCVGEMVQCVCVGKVSHLLVLCLTLLELFTRLTPCHVASDGGFKQ